MGQAQAGTEAMRFDSVDWVSDYSMIVPDSRWCKCTCGFVCRSLSFLSRNVFCSGLGVMAIFSREPLPSSILREGGFSARVELTDPLALEAPGGDRGVGSRDAAPLSCWIFGGGPSEDLRFRVAVGSALGGCLLFLNKKDMSAEVVYARRARTVGRDRLELAHAGFKANNQTLDMRDCVRQEVVDRDLECVPW